MSAGMKSRLTREKRTVETMIRLFCRDNHETSGELCSVCDELLAYAFERLDWCPYEAGKTTCAKCPTHCFKPAMREEIRKVMRYAGPRMIFRHPILAIFHYIDGLRKKPVATS